MVSEAFTLFSLQFNRPLYGDVFGVLQQEQDTIQVKMMGRDVSCVDPQLTGTQAAAEVDRTLWGEIEFDLGEIPINEYVCYMLTIFCAVHPVGEDNTPEQSDDDESMDMNEDEEDTDMENDDHGKEEEIVEIEIPGSIELRKDTRKADHDGNNDADEKDYENSENSPMSPRTLYKILKPKPTTIRGFMGSQHTYTGM